MKTVHIILNSHLDPVWLWSWRDGLDEVLNTSRYICGLLDRNPDAIFTRGEAWVYEQILKLDPELFARIGKHFQAGRWSIVGGWYIQPDCNQPSGFAMEKQINLGKSFFCKHFGTFPKVGYNVDSFGHSAGLPDYMAAAGQRYYVYTRPNSVEMKQPGRLFRWKGHENGREVIAFRPPFYAIAAPEEKHILDALTELPDGISHTMCFMGIGDHGGGPTEELLEWCRTHRESMDGVILEFSTVERFFAAVEPDVARLPLHIGELQQHAIGCYSVHHRVKSLLRKAEHAMAQVEFAIPAKERTESIENDLETAWKRVCFHHFHDTLGGTCLPSAYTDVEAQLGQALAIADDVSTFALRRKVVQLPDCPHQRLVFFNASDLPFDDAVEIEPWFAWTLWSPKWKVVDENGQEILVQAITPESGTLGPEQTRLLFSLKLLPCETKVLRIAGEDAASRLTVVELEVTDTSLRSHQGVGLDLARPKDGMEFPGFGSLPLPTLSLYDDTTDTWSHNISRYEREGKLDAEWEEPGLLERGAAMVSFCQRGHIGISELLSEWRVYADWLWIDWKLRVGWSAKKRILKLEWILPGIEEREDGVLGGSIRRATDGRELPFRDWTRLSVKGSNGKQADVAIISPDTYGLDCDASCVGLSLLRGAPLACHVPNPGTYPLSVFSDRGEQFFRFRFLAAEKLTSEYLDRVATGMQRPLLSMDVTKGMKTVFQGHEYQPLPL